MVFERKEGIEEKETGDVKGIFWSVLKWYWFIIPSIYFLFGLPGLLDSMEAGSPSFLNISTLFIQIITFLMGVNMHLMKRSEQSRKGVGDSFLKIAAFQQIFTENIIGFILVLVTWYKLPKVPLPDSERKEQKAEGEIKDLKPKTNRMIAFVLTILSLILAIARIVLI